MSFLYFTEQYLKKDSKYGSEVQLHFRNIEELDDPRPILKRFTRLPLFKKPADNLRIIIEAVELSTTQGIHTVYCVRRVFPRSANEYEAHFGWNQNIHRWHERNPISEEEREKIAAWLERELEQTRRSKLLPPLPDSLHKWINVRDLFLAETTIYETQEWTESIKNSDIYRNCKETIHQGILDIQQLDEQKYTIRWRAEGERHIFLVQLEKGISILFERVYTEGATPILVLYQIFKEEVAPPKPALITTTLANYEYNGQAIEREMLLRDAKRAYPDYILIDSELWFLIQEDEVANLALSPEEEKLLQKAEFPLFINGQAGSGKSTMLFYLFAHFCSIYKEQDPPPLFLTYSSRLLQTARENVLAILKRHPSFAEEKFDKKVLQTFFSPFQEYIKQQLLSPEALALFPENKYLSFSKFRQLFQGTHEQVYLNCKLPNARHFSPELVWHIIRTYLKGYHAEADFNQEHYRKLNRDDFSVSVEKFQEVYGTIWENWYKKLYAEHGYWDDQDLIRYVLNHREAYPQHAVIVCDESQDFTRIEIELLLKLSVFSHYDLSDCSNIPFSFAGDPYQTINPTGFRWESLKNIFNDRFQELNPQGLQIEFKALSQNYRSKPAIIKFTNLIQGFRFQYLNIKELRPQLAWQKMEGVSPILITTNHNSVRQLEAHALNTMTIVPTDDGKDQEREFVEQDPILRQYIHVPEQETEMIRNVISASNSKGSEFAKVIVYNFGESAPASFAKAIEGKDLSDNEFIELSHFFNKLYVAVSRAKDRLFVVDTQRGYDRFWSFFEQTDFLAEEFARDRSCEEAHAWKPEDVKGILLGDETSFSEMDGNPEENAVQFEESGMLRENPDDLDRARQFYKEAKRDGDALRCEAWMYWYQERWLLAGEIFQEMPYYSQAAKAYWRAQDWQRLKMMPSTSPMDRSIAEFMMGEQAVSTLFGKEDFFERSDANGEIWKKVIRKVQEGLTSPPAAELTQYADFAQQIAARGFPLFYNHAADLYFRAKSYEHAIKLWNRSSHTEHQNYYRSSLAISYTLPEKIQWHYKLKEDGEIVSLYQSLLQQSESNVSAELNPELTSILMGALLRQQEFGLAIRFPFLDLRPKIRRLLEALTGIKDAAIANNFKQDLFNLLLNEGRNGLDILKNNLRTFQNFFNNKKAIRLILQQENWADLLDALDKELRNAIPGKFIESFVDIVCEEVQQKEVSRLPYAIDLVGELNRRDDKLTENVKLIRAIAYSDVKPELFPAKLRERLEAFVQKCVWEQSGWQADLNFKEIGTALERLGAKSKTLQHEIYEYLIQYEPEFAEWAKLRWVKVAERRVEYERSIKRDFAARKIEADIRTQIRLWNIDKGDIGLEPDFPILYDPKGEEIIFLNASVRGYEGSPILDQRRKRMILEMEQCEVKINCTNQLVSIEDFSTGKTIDIDVPRKKIGGLEVEVSNGQETYHVENKIEVLFQEPMRVTLQLERKTLHISL